MALAGSVVGTLMGVASSCTAGLFVYGLNDGTVMGSQIDDERLFAIGLLATGLFVQTGLYFANYIPIQSRIGQLGERLGEEQKSNPSEALKAKADKYTNFTYKEKDIAIKTLCNVILVAAVFFFMQANVYFCIFAVLAFFHWNRSVFAYFTQSWLGFTDSAVRELAQRGEVEHLLAIEKDYLRHVSHACAIECAYLIKDESFAVEAFSTSSTMKDPELLMSLALKYNYERVAQQIVKKKITKSTGGTYSLILSEENICAILRKDWPNCKRALMEEIGEMIFGEGRTEDETKLMTACLTSISCSCGWAMLLRPLMAMALEPTNTRRVKALKAFFPFLSVDRPVGLGAVTFSQSNWANKLNGRDSEHFICKNEHDLLVVYLRYLVVKGEFLKTAGVLDSAAWDAEISEVSKIAEAGYHGTLNNRQAIDYYAATLQHALDMDKPEILEGVVSEVCLEASVGAVELKINISRLDGMSERRKKVICHSIRDVMSEYLHYVKFRIGHYQNDNPDLSGKWASIAVALIKKIWPSLDQTAQQQERVSDFCCDLLNFATHQKNVEIFGVMVDLLVKHPIRGMPRRDETNRFQLAGQAVVEVVTWINGIPCRDEYDVLVAILRPVAITMRSLREDADLLEGWRQHARRLIVEKEMFIHAVQRLEFLSQPKLSIPEQRIQRLNAYQIGMSTDIEDSRYIPISLEDERAQISREIFLMDLIVNPGKREIDTRVECFKYKHDGFSPILEMQSEEKEWVKEINKVLQNLKIPRETYKIEDMPQANFDDLLGIKKPPEAATSGVTDEDD